MCVCVCIVGCLGGGPEETCVYVCVCVSVSVWWGCLGGGPEETLLGGMQSLSLTAFL